LPRFVLVIGPFGVLEFVAMAHWPWAFLAARASGGEMGRPEGSGGGFFFSRRRRRRGFGLPAVVGGRGTAPATAVTRGGVGVALSLSRPRHPGSKREKVRAAPSNPLNAPWSQSSAEELPELGLGRRMARARPSQAARRPLEAQVGVPGCARSFTMISAAEEVCPRSSRCRRRWHL